MSIRDLAILGAELSAIAYLSHREVQEKLAAYGLRVTWFDHADAQGFMAEGTHEAWLVFRGTEASSLTVSDIWANLRVPLVRWAGQGQVHEGYGAEASKLWEQVRPALRRCQTRYYLAGHSMGAVLAKIISALIEQASDMLTYPALLLTYGSPAPGDAEFVASLRAPHYRFVNRIDFAQAWPPGPCYKHYGPALRVNSGGRPGPVSDHSIERYIEALKRRPGY